jgi:hypothetical protein
MDSKSIGLCPQGFESPRCRFASTEHPPPSPQARRCCEPAQRLFALFLPPRPASLANQVWHLGPSKAWALRGGCRRRARTARGFEPLRAEPNGFLVHLLNHSDALSCQVPGLASMVRFLQAVGRGWHEGKQASPANRFAPARCQLAQRPLALNSSAMDYKLPL